MTPDPFQRKIELPNSTATLVLGIMSIVLCLCCGFIGLLFGIIALVISSEPNRMYKENPDLYSGYPNLQAGRICAIIGIIFNALSSIISLIYVIIMGASLAPLMNQAHW